MRKLLYCAIRYALWGLAEIYRLAGVGKWERGWGGGFWLCHD